MFAIRYVHLGVCALHLTLHWNLPETAPATCPWPRTATFRNLAKFSDNSETLGAALASWAFPEPSRTCACIGNLKNRTLRNSNVPEPGFAFCTSPVQNPPEPVSATCSWPSTGIVQNLEPFSELLSNLRLQPAFGLAPRNLPEPCKTFKNFPELCALLEPSRTCTCHPHQDTRSLSGLKTLLAYAVLGKMN